MTVAINIITTLLLVPYGGLVIMSPMMIASKGFRDSPTSIITAMAIFAYPVLIFLVLKLFELRYFGMSVNSWLMGTALIAGGVIFIYRLPGLLINLKKGIPNSGYFIGESAVYLDGDKISKADPLSFEALPEDSRYARDQSYVFYYGKIVKEADPDTFTAVDNSLEGEEGEPAAPIYWKDAKKVYFRNQVIENADVESFSHISGLYAKDYRRVYYEGRVLEGADPQRFRFLQKNIVATDGTSIYIFHKRSKLKVDLESFSVAENENATFCKDKDHIYILLYQQEDPLVKVEGADPHTFTPLERSYAIDRHHVYFYGYSRKNTQKLVRLDGANPTKFEVGYDEATDSEARDGVKYYMYGQEIRLKKNK